MGTIEFTQYLRPHGNRRTVHVEVDDDYIYNKAIKLLEKGKFECEVLTTSQVVLYFSPNIDNLDPNMVICPNGVEVRHALYELINTAYDRFFITGFMEDKQKTE